MPIPDTLASASPRLTEHSWQALREQENATQHLERAAARLVHDNTAASPAWQIALALGLIDHHTPLDTALRLTLTPVVDRARRRHAGQNPRANLRWRVELTLGDTTHTTLTRALRDESNEPLALPWPDDDTRNIFREGTRPYCVRLEMRPLAGVYADDYRVTPAQTQSDEPVQREIGILNQPGTAHPRIVLCASAPSPDHEPTVPPPDLQMVIHRPARYPGDRPYAERIQTLDTITERVQRAASRRHHLFDAPFVLTPDSAAERALERYYRLRGLERPASTGYLLPDDLTVLTEQLADPTPFAPEHGIHSIASQEVRTPLLTFRDALSHLTQTLLGRATHTHESDGTPNMTAHYAPPLDLPRGTEPALGATRAIAAFLQTPESVLTVADTLRDWRSRARVQYLETGATATLPDDSPANALAHREIASRVVTSAHRLSEPVNTYRDEHTHTVPPCAWPFFAPTTINARATRRTSIAPTYAATLIPDVLTGTWLPALSLIDTDTEQRTAVPLNMLTQHPIEYEGITLLNGVPTRAAARPRYRFADPAETLCASLAAIPLARYADPTRIAMASHMATAAIPPAAHAHVRPRVLQPVNLAGTDPTADAPLPVFPARVALIEDPLSHEDGVRIARSTAERYLFARPDEITLVRDPQRDPSREYVGPQRADYDDVAADTGLSLAAFNKLDPDGLILPGTHLRPGDALQLYRVPHPDPDTSDRPWLYRFDPAPVHSHARVRAIHHSEPPPTEDPPLDENALAELLDDDLFNPVGQRSTITVQTMEDLPMDTMMKLTTLHATKGLTQVVPDKDMPVLRHDPVTGEPVIAEIAFSGSSIVARTAPADLLALRFGHLLDSRCATVLEAARAFDRHTAIDPAAPPETTLAERPGADTAPARAALETLRRTTPYLDVIHVHRRNAAPALPSLRAHIGAPEQGDPDQWTQHHLQALIATLGAVPAQTCLTYRTGAGTDERARLERALDYVTDEELNVQWAHAADLDAPDPDNRRLPVPAASGVMDMMVLIHHGRKMANEHPLGATHYSPLTGQPVGTPGKHPARIGLLEHDQFRSAAPDFALDALLHSDRQHAAQARQVLERTEEVRLPPERPAAAPRAQQSVAALAAACGWYHHPHGTITPLGDDQLLAQSAGPLDTRSLDHPFDANGDPNPDSLHDPAHFGLNAHQLAHLELHEPLLHPAAFNRRPGRRPPIVCALLDLTPRQLRELATTPAIAGTDNGPVQIRTRLLTLQRDIHTAPDLVIANAAHYAPLHPGPFVEAVQDLVSRPGYLPSNFVITHLPVLPPNLRQPYRAPGATAPTATHDLDALYARVLRTNHAAATRALKLHETTRALSRAVTRLVRRCETMLGGKRALLNRASYGFPSPVSARASILPADPRTIPSTHVEVSRRAARALYAHWAEPLLSETYGLTPTQSTEALERWARRKHLRSEDAPTHDVMTRIVSLSPCAAVRAPALHLHSAIALWPVLRDPITSPTLHATHDTSIRLHPAHCAGPNADFDGDSMSLYAPVSTDGAQSLLEGLTPSHHLVRWGNGKPLNLPAQGARAGLLARLNRPDATPSHHLRDILRPTPALSASLDTAFQRHPDPVWDTPGALHPPALAQVLEHLILDTAVAPAERSRAGDRLWCTGMTHCADNATPTFAAFESLGRLFHAGVEHDLIPEMRNVTEPRRYAGNPNHRHDDAFLRLAAIHFESACKVVNRWCNQPGALEALAHTLGESYLDDAPRAQRVLMTARGGGRLNVGQVVRTAIAAGGPTKLNARPCGTYNARGLIESVPAPLVPTTAIAGGEGKISGDSVIARAGALAHRLTQAVSSLRIVATDCDGPTEDNLLVVPPSPILEGAALARAVTDDTDTLIWPAGHTLTREDITLARHEDLLLPVRTIGTCRHAPDNACATCVGRPRAQRDRPLDIGTDIAQIAAACSNEQISQPVLKRFHAGGMLLTHEIARRTLCDAIVDAIGDRDNQADGETIEFDAAEARDPRPGWLSGLYTNGWLHGETPLATHALSEGLHALYEHGDAANIDPTHSRIIAHGLANPDPNQPVLPGLDLSTAANGPERHAATGNDPQRALSVFADPATARLLDPISRAYEERALRTQAPSRYPEVFRAVIADDLEAVKALHHRDPDALRATDEIGRTALFEARSADMVHLLCTRAKLDPTQPAEHDPNALRPIDTISVRPMPAHPDATVDAATRRAQVLRAALSHAHPIQARQCAKDPHLRATLNPAGPARRAATRARQHTPAPRARAATGATR